MVNVDKETELGIDGSVSWLFHLVRVKFVLEDEIQYKVKVLFITVKDSRKLDKKVDKKTNKKTDKKVEIQPNISINLEGKPSSRIVIRANEDSTEKETRLNIEKEAEKEVEKEVDLEVETSAKTDAELDVKARVKTDSKTKEKKGTKKSKNKKKKSKNDQSNVEKIKAMYNKIKVIWTDERYDGVIRFILGHVFVILKSVRPRKIRAKAIFGTGDPATTGYIIGAISMFYGVTKKSVQVIPDFMDKIFSGTVFAKGRVFLFVLLYHVVRTYFDKRVRALIKLLT
jgi:hypothetical protein